MKRTFTFIEFLVVIAILFILACIIVPEWAKAKEAAKMQEKAQKDGTAGVLKSRFVQSEDLAGVGMYTYHLKDTTTGREWLVVAQTGKNDSHLIEVTPPAKEVKAEVEVALPEKREIPIVYSKGDVHIIGSPVKEDPRVPSEYTWKYYFTKPIKLDSVQFEEEKP